MDPKGLDSPSRNSYETSNAMSGPSYAGHPGKVGGLLDFMERESAKLAGWLLGTNLRRYSMGRSLLKAIYIGALFFVCQWAQAEEFRIGATVSISGHFATEVGPFGKLLGSWANELNSKGGIVLGSRRVPVRLFLYDDRSDEATARRMYERLATVDRVNFMFGPYSSPLTFAASTAAEIHRIPFLAICANSPKIYERGYRWIACVIDEASRYTHRYWEMVRQEGLARSVSFVVEDTLHPRGVHQGAKILAEEANLKVLSSQIVPKDMKDFSAVITRLKEEDPDILFVASNVPFAIQFMSQARDLRLRPREFHVIHHGGPFIRLLGELAEGVTGQSYWTPEMSGPGSRRFLSLLGEAGINLEEYPWAPVYMMALQVIENVLSKCSTLDPHEVMATLRTSRTETLGGSVFFKENGVGSINPYPSQIQGGRYRIIWPPEVATSNHVYPSGASGR